MFLNRLWPYLTIILIFSGFEILFEKPHWIYFIVIFFIAWIFFILWKLLGIRAITKQTYWNFLITPVFLVLGGGLFIVFIEKAIIKHLLFLLISVLIGLFLEILFIYIHEHENYQSGALENVSEMINLISFYFYLSGIYGLAIFLSLPLWFEVILISPAITSLIHQTFWINKIEAKRSRFYLLGISLILIELFITIDNLPTSFYVNGFILTIFYYVMINISLNYFLGQIRRWTPINYLIFGFLMLLLILITAQWI